jgi:ankyrin repeat protein
MKEGKTPLMIAAKNGLNKTVRMLLDEDDINLRKPISQAVALLEWATSDNKKQNKTELVYSHLHEQFESEGLADLFKKFPDELSPFKSILLYHAANEGHTDVVDMLLKNGANMDMLKTGDKIKLIESAMDDKSWDVVLHTLLTLPAAHQSQSEDDDDFRSKITDKQAAILKEKFVDFIVQFNKKFPEKSAELNDYIMKIQEKNSALAVVFDQPLHVKKSALSSIGQFSHHETQGMKISGIIMQELAKLNIGSGATREQELDHRVLNK